MNWHHTTLGDLIELFDHRRIPLNSRQRAERQGPYPYYGAQGVIDQIDGYLFDGRYLLVPEDGENLNSRKLPIAYFARGRFWVNNHAHILRGRNGIADDDFLKHLLNATDITGYVTGAAQPKLSQQNLRRIQLRVPTFQVQQRIARILSAYDDLIEVNTRRIAILEQMVSGLFDEWFVKHRFPGHAITSPGDDPQPLPQAWERCALLRLIDLRYGKALKADQRQNGTVPVYGSSGIVGHHNEPLVEGPGIIVGRKGNVGAVYRSEGPFYPIDTVFYVATSWPLSFIYYLLKNQSFLNSDSAVPGLNRAQALRTPIDLPPMSLAEEFHRHAGEFFRLIGTLNNASEKLRESRDLLLPKLISGEIDLSGAEREVDRAAAE